MIAIIKERLGFRGKNCFFLFYLGLTIILVIIIKKGAVWLNSKALLDLYVKAHSVQALLHRLGYFSWLSHALNTLATFVNDWLVFLQLVGCFDIVVFDLDHLLVFIWVGCRVWELAGWHYVATPVSALTLWIKINHNDFIFFKNPLKIYQKAKWVNLMCAHSIDFYKHCRCRVQCLQNVYAMINNDTYEWYTEILWFPCVCQVSGNHWLLTHLMTCIQIKTTSLQTYWHSWATLPCWFWFIVSFVIYQVNVSERKPKNSRYDCCQGVCTYSYYAMT